MTAHETKGLDEAERQAGQVLEQLDQAFAFQSADGNELQRKTRFRNDCFFETALRPNKNTSTVGAARDVFASDRDRGVNVSAGTTARHHQCFRYGINSIVVRG